MLKMNPIMSIGIANQKHQCNPARLSPALKVNPNDMPSRKHQCNPAGLSPALKVNPNDMPSRNRVIEANCGTLPLDEEFAMLNSLAHIVLRFFYTRIGDL